MIVTCEECSTRFNLDDSLIKDDGSKVRCSVCHKIFTVHPVPAQPETDPDTGTLPPFSEEGAAQEDGFDFEDTDLALDEGDFGSSDDDFTIEGDSTPEEAGIDTPVDDDTTLDFEEDTEEDFDSLEFEAVDQPGVLPDFEDDQPSDLDPDDGSGLVFESSDPDDLDIEPMVELETDMDEPPELEIEPELEFEEDTTLEMDIDSEKTVPEPEERFDEEDDFELEFDVTQEDTDKKDLDELDETVDEPGLEGADDSSGLIDTHRNEDPDDMPPELPRTTAFEKKPPVITPEDDFSAYDDVLQQETEPEISPLDSPGEETQTVPEKKVLMGGKEKSSASSVRSRRKKKSAIGAPVLVLLLIFLLVVGAYIASLMTGYKIPYLSDVEIPYLEKIFKKAPDETSAIKPKPNQQTTKSRFVKNSTAGELLVITGTVDNLSQTSCSYIKIEGALVTKGDHKVKTKTVFCGNIIDEEMLKSGSMAEIDKILATKEGHHNSNVNLKPGGSIAFMLVFSDLPGNLQNFDIKVIDFKANING